MAKVLKKVVRNFDLLADDGQRFLLHHFDFKVEHRDDFIGRMKIGLPMQRFSRADILKMVKAFRNCSSRRSK